MITRCNRIYLSRVCRSLLAGFAMAALFAAAPAHPSPIHYDISFTGGLPGPIPTAGSFDYDPASPSFTNFSVIWNGLTFDLTSSANNPDVIDSAFSSSCNGASGAALAFAMMSSDPCITSIADSSSWEAVSFPALQAFLFFAQENDPVFLTDRLRIQLTADLGDPEQERSSGGWSISAASVPEPPTLALISLCLAILGWVERRRYRFRPSNAT
jgi:hypothetical protein